MKSNSAILKKADMALAELTSNGGVLNPEQSNTFIRTALEQPTMLQQARIVVMTGPQKEINKIGFGSRIMKPAVEGTGLILADRSKPLTSKIALNTKEIIAEIRLPYSVVEDNIERGSVNFGGSNMSGGIVDTIVAMIAERAALDLEELALLGDTASGDPYLALVDGWMKRATSHVVDSTAAKVSRTLFKNGLLAMPNPYKRSLAALKHFVSVNQGIEYADTLASRETALGDAKHQTPMPNYGAGVIVEGAALMPDALGLLTLPKNLIFGIQRDISFEAEKLISERSYKIVVTARVDAQIEEEDAVVKYTNIVAP